VLGPASGALTVTVDRPAGRGDTARVMKSHHTAIALDTLAPRPGPRDEIGRTPNTRPKESQP